MRTRPRSVGAALVVAVLLPLTGCGGNSIDDYCADLTAHRTEMADMIDSPSTSGLLSHLPMMRDLADKAPDDLVDEWQVFLDALGVKRVPEFEDWLQRIGITGPDGRLRTPSGSHPLLVRPEAA